MKADEKRARQVVRERSGGVCELQISGVCLGRATNFSHRKRRGQGGEWSATNGMDSCGSGTTGCHGYVTDPPRGKGDEVGEKGWTVKSWNDPALIPVQYRDYPERMFLLADGGMTDASWEALMLAGYGYPVGGDAA